MRVPFVRPIVMLILATTFAGACVKVWSTVPKSVAIPSEGTSLGARVIATPVKAHMADGSTVIFANGAMFSGRTLTGSGRRFAPLEDVVSTPLEVVPLDS